MTYRIVPEKGDYRLDGYRIEYRSFWFPFWQRLDYKTYGLEEAKALIEHLNKPVIYPK